MAERGIIIEFDFAVANGAETLFGTAKEFLAKLDGIPFGVAEESRHLFGKNILDGLTGYFTVLKTKKTPQKAARDLSSAFRTVLEENVPSAITSSFRNFVKALVERDVKVVISTRATVDKVSAAFAPVLGEKVSLYQETSSCYGSVKWDSWRRACKANKLSPLSTLAVAGSGASVKSALLAGLGSVAVVNGHVAYQDFGGASDVFTELSGPTAKRILEIMHIQ